MSSRFGEYVFFFLEGNKRPASQNECFRSTFQTTATSARGNFAIEEYLDLTSQRESIFLRYGFKIREVKGEEPWQKGG